MAERGGAMRRKPNFFIVGAPKSGTTAMDAYLSEHPDVFMAQKEPHYFAVDLLPADDRC
ncbi:MAG: sulfotransferase [Alphaproteobacteria bacterium]|nr:sulfotransferase [Alphaproteobacteria bacterium]